MKRVIILHTTLLGREEPSLMSEDVANKGEAERCRDMAKVNRSSSPSVLSL